LSSKSEKQKILVTSALPYANGLLHVGQLAGAYLPADLFVRYHRRVGNDVVFICGSDEHGVAITLAADARKTTPQAIVDSFHPKLKATFDRAAFTLDHYGRTSSPEHHKTAQAFFKVLHDGGWLVTRTEEQFYDEKADRWLPDRYVEGTCPHCDHDAARGDECEKCGTWIEAKTLINPRSKLTGNTPILKETTHWYFKLSEIAPELERWMQARDAAFGWKNNVLTYCRAWFKKGLKDRPISRDLEWGVPVPLEGAEGKAIYVWFENVLGYISATKEWAAEQNTPERWKDFWLNQNSRLIHFIGKDNIIFHALLFPAMLLAYNKCVPEEERFVLPENVPANEFLNIEGQKLSTSRNWAIWVDDVLDAFPVDYLRYYTTWCLPETRDTDFSWDEFAERVNSELADIYGNLANRTLVFINKYLDGTVPEMVEPDEDSRALMSEVARLVDAVADSIEKYRFREATKLMMDIARAGNKYFADQQPWKSRKENPAACNRSLHSLCQLLASLTIVSEPFLPVTAARLAGQLGIAEATFLGWNWKDAASGNLLKSGSPLGKIEVLFNKLDPAVIEEQRAKLGSSPGEDKADEEAVNIVPIEEALIGFDDFTAIDLRVAEVVEAEAIPKAKKLLRLIVSLGAEQRQVVAGIAKHYKPEELVGKRIVIVANLKPAKLMGVESQGMILAASSADKATLRLLTVDGDLHPGARVS
jgi:methionyl-tRNA synthetase